MGITAANPLLESKTNTNIKQVNESQLRAIIAETLRESFAQKIMSPINDVEDTIAQEIVFPSWRELVKAKYRLNELKNMPNHDSEIDMAISVLNDAILAIKNAGLVNFN